MIATHRDYEVRSKVDLKRCGAQRYAVDPSTEIMLCAVSDDAPDAPVYLWVNPKFRTADMLGDAQADALLLRNSHVWAHNLPFEFAVSEGTGRFQFPAEMGRCTMAMARKAGLPPSLEKCAEALGLKQQKDTRGSKLIKLFCIPNEDGTFNEPKDFPEEWYQFGEYCRQDVRVEKAIHQKLKAFELSGAPLETFLFTLRMNQRGIPVDVPALKNAQKIIEYVQSGVTEEFRKVTGLNPTQREKVRLLVDLPNMQAETVEEAIKANHPNRGILEMYQKLSYAAIAKIETMLDCVCPDGRIRGMFTYYGAGTGRWTAQMVQPHNFKKTPKWMRSIMHQVYRAICDGRHSDWFDLIYGDPLELLSGVIRHFISAKMDGDYNAIEARIICWLAGQDDILRMWKEGRDLYKYMASIAYGVSEQTVDSDQREVGKRIELGCSYQMGPAKFKESCLIMYQLDLPLELCERGVEVYRSTHPKVVQYWYFLDNSARAAIASPGTQCGPFIVKYVAGIKYLLFRLRSGRSLAYPHIAIEKREPTREEIERMKTGYEYDPKRFQQITYWGQLFQSTQWGRIKLYGGKLAENETQATAADIMGHGSIVAEMQGMPPFALIHDQGLAEHPEGKTPEDFAAALATLPPWAKGLPLKVEAKACRYYTK